MKEQQHKLIHVNSTRKSSNDPKNRHFQQSEQEIVETVCLKRKTALLITCGTIKYKAQKLAISHSITGHHYQASMRWCVHYAEEKWVLTS